MPAQERTNEHANEHETFATLACSRNQKSAFDGDGANFRTNFAETTTCLAVTDIERRPVSSRRRQAPSADFAILR